MMGLLFKFLGGPLVSGIVDVVKNHQNRKATEAEIKGEVSEAVMAAFSSVSEQQANVIIAEAQGESWLQRTWRPIVAISFAFVVVFYALILPIAVDWFGVPPVRVGDKLLEWVMSAVMLCLGGYIGGRSLEKIAKTVMSRLR